MSTAIMHSTSLYDFGEYPRKNQTNSSRGNTQVIVGSGGVGSNVTSANGAGNASSSSNSSHMLLSQGFSVAAALAATSGNNNLLNAQQSVNANHHAQQQQQQQSQSSQQLLHQYPYGGLHKQTGQHKQQQQQQQHHANNGGAHHALHRTASQPSARFVVENILEILSLNKVMDNAAMAGITTASGSNSASNSSSANSINNNNNTNNNNSGNNHTSNTSSSSGHRKLERTQSEPLPQQVNTSRYKTELCRPYEEAGECKYGDKCQFAHGMQELRNLQRHPKYKTELCRTFHSVGFCPYGPRCHFVHNAEEARNHNRNVAAYHARLAAAAAGNASQSSQSAAKNNGPSALNSNSQQQHHAHHGQQQQHVASGLNSVSVAQLQTAAALLQQTSIAAAHHQQQHHLHQRQQHHHHQVPLSPALSMSTGSDRASPIGSLSLSPTTSMANFFPDASSPTFQQTALHQAFNFQNSPPASPVDGLSPMATPPPSSPSLCAMKLGGSMVLGGVHGGGNTNAGTGLEERLPVFNLLSCMDPFVNPAL
ncbi:protein TIS11 [Anopheles nili]|uniref:protein TIS11 n=1 Tax=Anopheles nili TaxID=185578 RepID=UPI00237A7543|nr:protein TIS11 [Anopheles nili]